MSAKSYEERKRDFWIYHRAHPWVYEKYVEFARLLYKKGYRKFGIGFLSEGLRWEHMVHGKPDIGADGYKINNNYRAFYARLLRKRIPKLKGVLTFRRQRKL